MGFKRQADNFEDNICGIGSANSILFFFRKKKLWKQEGFI